MRKLILAGALVLAATGAQAQDSNSNPNSPPLQPYTTLGPAGAGAYVEPPHPQANPNGPRRHRHRATGNANPKTAAVGARNPRH
jgi:hypothetical protein